MRFFSLITFTLATGIALAADGVKPVTYLEGNLEGFAPNASATLEFRDSRVLALHVKDTDVVIPYAVVSKTSRKTVQVLAEKDPIYKVWTIHKRLLIPNPLEQVTLSYKNQAGADKSLTLEMDKAAADRLQAHVEQATERNAANAGAWWGDSVWKTGRNKDQWGGAGIMAQRE